MLEFFFVSYIMWREKSIDLPELLYLAQNGDSNLEQIAQFKRVEKRVFTFYNFCYRIFFIIPYILNFIFQTIYLVNQEARDSSQMEYEDRYSFYMICISFWQAFSSLGLFISFMYLASKYHKYEFKQDVCNIWVYYGLIIMF